jgi:hypothetical protein
MKTEEKFPKPPSIKFNAPRRKKNPVFIKKPDSCLGGGFSILFPLIV